MEVRKGQLSVDKKVQNVIIFLYKYFFLTNQFIIKNFNLSANKTNLLFWRGSEKDYSNVILFDMLIIVRYVSNVCKQISHRQI